MINNTMISKDFYDLVYFIEDFSAESDELNLNENVTSNSSSTDSPEGWIEPSFENHSPIVFRSTESNHSDVKVSDAIKQANSLLLKPQQNSKKRKLKLLDPLSKEELSPADKKLKKSIRNRMCAQEYRTKTFDCISHLTSYCEIIVDIGKKMIQLISNIFMDPFLGKSLKEKEIEFLALSSDVEFAPIEKAKKIINFFLNFTLHLADQAKKSMEKNEILENRIKELENENSFLRDLLDFTCSSENTDNAIDKS